MTDVMEADITKPVDITIGTKAGTTTDTDIIHVRCMYTARRFIFRIRRFTSHRPSIAVDVDTATAAASI